MHPLQMDNFDLISYIYEICLHDGVLETFSAFWSFSQGIHLALIDSFQKHADVIKWKHIPRYWSFVWGIHLWPVNSPHKGQWRGALMLPLIYAWINGWVNNCEAGDLRRHRTHYDVIVMVYSFGALVLLLMLVWTDSWTDSGVAGDLRRQYPHLMSM